MLLSGFVIAPEADMPLEPCVQWLPFSLCLSFLLKLGENIVWICRSVSTGEASAVPMYVSLSSFKMA